MPPLCGMSISSTSASDQTTFVVETRVGNFERAEVLGGIFMIFLMVIILLYYILSVVALA